MTKSSTCDEITLSTGRRLTCARIANKSSDPQFCRFTFGLRWMPVGLPPAVKVFGDPRKIQIPILDSPPDRQLQHHWNPVAGVKLLAGPIHKLGLGRYCAHVFLPKYREYHCVSALGCIILVFGPLEPGQKAAPRPGTLKFHELLAVEDDDSLARVPQNQVCKTKTKRNARPRLPSPSDPSPPVTDMRADRNQHYEQNHTAPRISTSSLLSAARCFAAAVLACAWALRTRSPTFCHSK